MNNKIIIFAIGILVGAASWGVVSLVSDRYEPFDSGLGFYIGQFILSIIAFWVGYKKRFRDLAVYLIGAYIGMNAYAYIFGGSEQRAWASLGMVTTIALVIFPLVFGVIGIIVSSLQQKYNKAN